MVNGSNCLMSDGALSSGAPKPRDPIPPPRGQKVYILV